MEYSITQLAKLAGISTRTLRYYHQIGLLQPSGATQAGYRCYGPQQLEQLQQILFYKERGFGLKQIKNLMEKPNFDPIEAMYDHLENLKQQQERLSCLIEAVTNTIREMKGERSMSDQEKFFAFQKQIKENEKQYGLEARTLYGEDPVHQTNQKLLAMNPSQAQIFQKLEADIKNKLERAVSTGELPQGEIGKKVVQLHKQWLCCVWESYSPQAHRGLAHLYTADERFRAYYDNRLFGCAHFLQQAILHWISI